MKLFKSLLFASCFLAAGLFTVACSGGEATSDAAGKETTSADAPEGLEGLLGAYVTLKDALVETDFDGAKKGMETFDSQLDKMSANAENAIAAQVKELKTHSDLFLKAADVEAQRIAFKSISDILIGVAKTHGTGSDKYYLQHCPMAFDNTGADWISAADEVLNPYFGDMMLRCGTVKGEL